MDNITLAPIKHKLMTKEEAKENALKLLERVNLVDKAEIVDVYGNLGVVYILECENYILLYSQNLLWCHTRVSC